MPVQITVATRKYSDYILSPDLTETAVQDAIPTESYGNFGLTWKDGKAPYKASISGCAAFAATVQPADLRQLF
jgi:hypothetical protein